MSFTIEQKENFTIEERGNYHYLIFIPWNKEQFIAPNIRIPNGCKLVVICTKRVSKNTTWQGIAFCSKKDTPNVNLGKWLAKQRACGKLESSEKYYKQYIGY